MPNQTPKLHEILRLFTESLSDYAEATRNMSIALKKIHAEARSASTGAQHISETFKVRH